MKTISKKKRAVKIATEIKPLVTPATVMEGAAYEHVPIANIEVSPLNYRKYFDQKALEDFAQELAAHGILSPLLLRPAPSGGYELVAGERRFRAAKIAGIVNLPALIRELSDELVIELQLAENLQREDPHPLHEAQAVSRMQQTGKTIEEIAARLGKSKGFVYSRIKLSGLIEIMQDIFLANKITVNEAYQVARLSPDSQYEFYEEYCTDWQDNDFEFPGSYAIDRFRYDLTRAPFDIKDKTLVAEKGACTNCPLNSATLKTLFPEMAKESVCSGRECYLNKCRQHYARQIIDAAEKLSPQALVYTNSRFFEEVFPIVDSIENLRELPRYSKWGIHEIQAPTPPDKDDYMETDEQNGYFNEESYMIALDEYNSELEDYHKYINDGIALSGLLITENSMRFILFCPHGQQQNGAHSGNTQVTAKKVQEAIKEGTITVEMLDAEIERINGRESRSQELDQEKVQLQMHSQFLERFSNLEHNTEMTAADHVAVRLIVFQSLDYHVRHDVEHALGLDGDSLGKDHFFETLSGLTDAQFAYMVRTALAGNASSNKPGNINAWCLTSVAEAAGLDVEAIRQAQQQIAQERQERVAERIKEMEKRRQKLMKVKALEQPQAAA
jgi:ParB/RepB/Spo0J family partition protein